MIWSALQGAGYDLKSMLDDDIVVVKKHIAVCSDKRNEDGIPFIIHHDSKGAREANDINNYTIVGTSAGIVQKAGMVVLIQIQINNIRR